MRSIFFLAFALLATVSAVALAVYAFRRSSRWRWWILGAACVLTALSATAWLKSRTAVHNELSTPSGSDCGTTLLRVAFDDPSIRFLERRGEPIAESEWARTWDVWQGLARGFSPRIEQGFLHLSGRGPYAGGLLRILDWNRGVDVSGAAGLVVRLRRAGADPCHPTLKIELFDTHHDPSAGGAAAEILVDQDEWTWFALPFSRLSSHQAPPGGVAARLDASRLRLVKLHLLYPSDRESCELHVDKICFR